MNRNAFKDKKYHYVYKITDPETGDFYIGVRSSNEPCELDSYMSSGAWSQYNYADFSGKIKTLIKMCDEREKAEKEERQEIARHAGNPKLRNRQGHHSSPLIKTRNTMGLTQKELAVLIKETEKTIQKYESYERDNVKVPKEYVKKIADLYSDFLIRNY